MLLGIGQFSKICNVSVKTLRYYDSIGLLNPEFVDRLSGYRYYDEGQLEKMLLINRLKRYGFSLSEIAELIDSDKKELFLKLKGQISVITAEINHKKMLLKEIKSILNNYERTGEMMSYTDNYEISIIKTDDIYILSSRQNMSVEDFGKYYGRLFEKIASEKIRPTGKVLAIYHDKEFDEKNSDIEVGVEIADREKATNVLKASLCVKTTHKGSYANLTEAYAAVVKYIDGNGKKIAAPPYEIYRKSFIDNLPADKWETDIYFPIEK